MDGGLPKWIADKYPVDEGAPVVKPVEGDYSYSLKEDMIYNYEQTKALSDSLKGGEQGKVIVDARPKEAYEKGNIPGAINVPTGLYFNPETKEVKSAEALAAIFEERGVTKDKFVVFHCQRAITGCSSAFAFMVSGGSMDKLAVYDGSYAEYGNKKTD